MKENAMSPVDTGGGNGSGGRIVVGVDGSPSSVEALRWAAHQAFLTGDVVHAVTSWVWPAAYGYMPVVEFDWAENAGVILERALAEALGEVGSKEVGRHVVEGHPALALLDAAVGANLLVVGSRGHGGFSGMLLGSVSQHVVCHALCPVLVVHGKSAS
jgi:nucleotide-binding universal stress UspA family protein